MQAVLDSYLDFMEKTYRDVSVEIATLLDVKLKENDKQFEQAQKELLEIKRQSRANCRCREQREQKQ